MPAWGGGGGGPLTDQQLEEIIFYLRSVQISEDEIRSQVDSGVEAGAKALILETSDESWAVEVRAAEAAQADAAMAVRLLGRADFDFECSDDISVPHPRRRQRPPHRGNEAAVEPLDAAVATWFDQVSAAKATADALRSRPTRRSPMRVMRTTSVRGTRNPLDPRCVRGPGGVPPVGRDPLQQHGGRRHLQLCPLPHLWLELRRRVRLCARGERRDGPIPELADGYVTAGASSART